MIKHARADAHWAITPLGNRTETQKKNRDMASPVGKTERRRPVSYAAAAAGPNARSRQSKLPALQSDPDQHFFPREVSEA